MPYVIQNDCDHPVVAHGFQLPAKGRSRVLDQTELNKFNHVAVEGVRIVPYLLETVAVVQEKEESAVKEAVLEAEPPKAQPENETVIGPRKREGGRQKKTEAIE